MRQDCLIKSFISGMRQVLKKEADSSTGGRGAEGDEEGDMQLLPGGERFTPGSGGRFTPCPAHSKLTGLGVNNLQG